MLLYFKGEPEVEVLLYFKGNGKSRCSSILKGNRKPRCSSMLTGNGKSRCSSISEENGKAQVLLYFKGPWEKESNEKRETFSLLTFFFAIKRLFFSQLSGALMSGSTGFQRRFRRRSGRLWSRLRCFQRLASQHAAEIFVKISRCGCWGYR